MAAEIDLLYEQGPCLVVNKPGGVLTQAVPGVDSMEVRLRAFLAEREGKAGGKMYLGVPHRLDRPVSGAIVFARHVRATRRLAEQFEGRMVRKVYWGLAEGVVADDDGILRDFMRKVPDEPRAELVDRQHADARLAILQFRVRRRWDAVTWLEIELETGRTHQIRLQSASHGFPIAGDELYGARLAFGPATADTRERWIALHARLLCFRHPMNRQEVQVTAPLPAAWQSFGLSDATVGP